MELETASAERMPGRISGRRRGRKYFHRGAFYTRRRNWKQPVCIECPEGFQDACAAGNTSIEGAFYTHRRNWNRKKRGAQMGTLVVGLLVCGMVALVIRSMARDRKNGKSIQCGGDCGHCGGHCH